VSDLRACTVGGALLSRIVIADCRTRVSGLRLCTVGGALLPRVIVRIAGQEYPAYGCAVGGALLPRMSTANCRTRMFGPRVCAVDGALLPRIIIANCRTRVSGLRVLLPTTSRRERDSASNWPSWNWTRQSVVSPAIQLSTGHFLSNAAPLFEKERHPCFATLPANGLNPGC
jgi:hypothetical protein